MDKGCCQPIMQLDLSRSLSFALSPRQANRHTHPERERDTANVIRNLSVVLSRVHLGPLLSSLSLSSCGTQLMPLQERLELLRVNYSLSYLSKCNAADLFGVNYLFVSLLWL